jgi:hypothetical protein
MPDMQTQRLREAESIIDSYSVKHMTMDVGIGVLGLLPVPFLGTAALLTTIGAQAPVIYQPMVRKIGTLYAQTPNELTDESVRKGVLAAAIVDVAAQFGKDFIIESAREILHDNVGGVALSAIPVVGGIFAAGVDAIVARKVTKIVGAMALVYFENPFGWVVSRNTTRALVAALIATKPSASVAEIVIAVLTCLELGTLTRTALVDASTKHKSWEGTTAFVDSAFAGAATAEVADSVQQPVIDALEYWKHASVDVHDLDSVNHALNDIVENSHTVDAFKGHVGEVVAHDDLPGSKLADSPTQPAWDLEHHGVEWQVKTGTTAFSKATEALRDHPEHPIITDEHAEAALHAEHAATIGLADLSNDHLLNIIDRTQVSIGELVNAHPHLPILGAISACLIELTKYKNGEIGGRETIANIGARLGTRALGIFFALKLAIILAILFGGVSIAGPAIAGAAVVGALSGRELAEKLCKVKIPARFAEQLVRLLEQRTPRLATA